MKNVKTFLHIRLCVGRFFREKSTVMEEMNGDMRKKMDKANGDMRKKIDKANGDLRKIMYKSFTMWYTT